jgi:pyrroline-5-carboxylate reductase
VLVADPHTAHLQDLARSLGVVAADSNIDAARNADIVLLAVKPYNVEPVLREIAPALARDEGAPLLICIAAGVSTARIESILASLDDAPRVPIVRAMPNTPAQVGKGACAYCKGSFAEASHLQQAGEIFQSVGIAVEVPESMMDAVTALSGSGPAYIYLMIEAMVDGGVRAGLPRDIAAKLASQTVLGAAQMVIDTGKHPAQLRDMVTTPAGTTIEALASLEHSGLRAALIDAIGKAAQRSRELG